MVVRSLQYIHKITSEIKSKNIIFQFIIILCVWYLHVYVPGVHRYQKRALNSVKWVLDVGVSNPGGARNETKANALNY